MEKIIKAAKSCIEFIEQDKGNSSFVNVERVMEEHGISLQDDGKASWFIPWDPQYENIVVWIFNNEEAQEVWQMIIRLLKEENKGIQLQGTQPIVYLVDGKTLTFPLIKSIREYKTPRWLPVVMSIQKINNIEE